ncbi:unnamed protein product [Chironomus riparius]|uniref:DUF4780 domain-containing protein n=1 Tax=Chironomus riparius TaxID=315576 RepID=A0A9N9RZR0_9DIPT|nr:unnamed protein product [Chironomus riparius]
MSPRKSRSNVDRKKFNKCAYCRNHREESLAKGHRGKCRYNNKGHFEECIDCKQNYRKTVNMQRYRENNCECRFDESNVTSGTGEEVIARFDDDHLDIEYDYETLSLKEEHLNYSDDSNELANSDCINSGSGESEFTIIIMHSNYPFRFLSKEYADQFMAEIENFPETSTAADLKIQYIFFEKGYIKVVCLDEETRRKVLKLAEEFKHRYPRPKIIAINGLDLLTIIKMSCKLCNKQSIFLKGDEFLKEIQERNKLDTSSWIVDEGPEPSAYQKVCFSVDIFGAFYISSRDFYLDIKGECVRVCVRSKRELEVMYASSLL